MDAGKLKEIAKQAEEMGFQTRVKSDEYVQIRRWVDEYFVEIVYDINRVWAVGSPVFISTSSVNSDNLNTWKEFLDYIEKAIQIAEKLKE